MTIRLYDYQREMRDAVLEALESHNAVMCQMPTGTGKTHVLASVVSNYANGKLVWVVVHRKELIEQITTTWDACYKDKRNAPDVKVMSIQWLARNWETVANNVPSMLVIDEAHHALAETYQELFRRYPEAKKLGMTATPYRMSGKGFTDLFDILLQSKSIPDFITENRLSLFDYYAVPQNSKIRRQIALLKKRGAHGDYQTKELDLSLNTPRNIEYLYNSLMRYAKGRKGIVYAININHARAIADFYAANGLRCYAIDCNTSEKERREMVTSFRNGNIDVMVNVDIFSEGFDCPEVEFIQLARPTLSLAVYLQQIGRGLRKAKGKKYCVILDNVGLSRTFGTPVRKWNWDKMFKGTMRNVRIDSLDRSALLKYYGYPGKLADEPMEKIISHTDMFDAISRQNILKYYPASNLVGVVLKGKVVARKQITDVIAYKHDAVVVRLADKSVCLIFPTGKELELPSDSIDFEIQSDKIIKVTTMRGTIYHDMVTTKDFAERPIVRSYGPMEFLDEGSKLWRRMPYYAIEYYKNSAYPPTWMGWYLKIYSICPISAKVYIPNSTLGGGRGLSFEQTALFPYDLYDYYIVEELTGGKIIVVDLNCDYYLVSSDNSRKFLFKATSYLSSKQELDQWLSRLE